ncbi:MAG: amidohydrolase family protein [Candidatus Methanoperedens sp.]|nr:amidohydrolase family protein [Candidatus Methanoperedens sp.]
MADLIINGGKVLTMDGTVINKGTVVVDKGLIKYVGKTTKEKAEKVIDAQGCVVMPGLVNAHTHVPMTLFRGIADGLSYAEWMKKIQMAETKLTSSDVRSGAYLGILEMIRSGTTTFADMYIHEDEVAQVVEETGIRAALGYGMIEGLNEDTDTKLKSREIFVKKWNGAADGRITTMYAPHSAASCSKEFLIKVKELAQSDNSRVHIHILETEDELKTMKKRFGMCSVNLLNSIGMLGPSVLAAHCIWLSDDDIDILKEKEVNVVHCPSSNMALGTGVSPVPKMLGKGINVALGTDGAASGGSLDMWKEMRCTSLLHRLKDPQAMPPSKILEMATVNGAKAIGINAGVLAPGRLADIIIVDIKKPQFTSMDLSSALVHGAAGCDVRTTIVGGRILMEEHRVDLDEDMIIEDAGEAMKNKK